VFSSAWFADAYGLNATVSGDTFREQGQHHYEARPCRPARALTPSRARHLGRAAGLGAAGQQGEIRMRGHTTVPITYLLPKGYWELTRMRQRRPLRRLAGYTTEDIGVRDEDGFTSSSSTGVKEMIAGRRGETSRIQRSQTGCIYEHEWSIGGRCSASRRRWGEVTG